MSARKPTTVERRDIIAVADNVFDQLQDLPYPPHAANALAIANAKLIIESENPEIRTEAEAREMMAEMTEAVIGNWKALRADGLNG